jgi:hypothetical protein
MHAFITSIWHYGTNWKSKLYFTTPVKQLDNDQILPTEFISWEVVFEEFLPFQEKSNLFSCK